MLRKSPRIFMLAIAASLSAGSMARAATPDQTARSSSETVLALKDMANAKTELRHGKIEDAKKSLQKAQEVLFTVAKEIPKKSEAEGEVTQLTKHVDHALAALKSGKAKEATHALSQALEFEQFDAVVFPAAAH